MRQQNLCIRKKYSSSKMRSLSSQRVKRLTRLSGLVPSGILVATLGSWVLLLPTIPLMSAASVVKCLAPCRWACQDTLVLKRPVWHDIGGGCHSSSAPSGLVALSSKSI